jgi:hypothetical protein
MAVFPVLAIVDKMERVRYMGRDIKFCTRLNPLDGQRWRMDAAINPWFRRSHLSQFFRHDSSGTNGSTRLHASSLSLSTHAA